MFLKRKKKTMLSVSPKKTREMMMAAELAIRDVNGPRYAHATYEGKLATAFGKVKKKFPKAQDRHIILAVAIAENYDGG